MTIELYCLLFSTVLGFVHVMTQVVTQARERKTPYDPNRDNPVVLGLYGGRAQRALQNFLETYPLFIAAIVVLTFVEEEGFISNLGAMLYLGARTAYLPLYIAGLGPIRSIAWGLSLLGLVLLFLTPLV